MLIDYKKARDLPDDKIVYMSTGSQGEPMAVLAAWRTSTTQIEPGPGDTVILASSLIPGNENAVYRVIDGLTKLGANVVHKGNAKVHVSGHAAAGELLYCYNILQAHATCCPVHGEYRHLIANAKLAQDTGIPAERTIIGENGTVIDLKDGVATRRRPARPRLRLRRRLDRRRDHRCRPQGPPDPRRGGLHLGHRRGGCRDRAHHHRARRSTPAASPRTTRSSTSVKPKIAAALAEAAQSGVRDTHALSQVVRRTIGRWVNQQLRRRPMIVPLVIEA